MSASVRDVLADGKFHRVPLRALQRHHNEADIVSRLAPLHVEVRGRKARQAPKAFCSLCARFEARIARLEREVAELRGAR